MVTLSPRKEEPDQGESGSSDSVVNYPKTILRRTLLILVLAGLFVLTLVFLFNFILKSPSKEVAVQLTSIGTTNKQAKVGAGLPVRLKIPKINVDAAIDHIGLMSNGDMEAPAGPKTVGWSRFGPRPGDTGSAVMDGHYGRWTNGEGSVFDSLSKLKKGDSLYVEDEKGVTTTFLVREFRIYNPEADASNVFKSNDGSAHLNLITCDGAWDEVSKSYSKRLVLFTDKK